MCELLGMSANVPTDICFSFSGLAERGGNTGPHKDGWGIAFYEGKSSRTFKSPLPSTQCQIAQLLKQYPIKSELVLSHIRQANSGKVCLDNTHPFHRELWGHEWTYAHNGQLNKRKLLSLTSDTEEFYKPIGQTDSEIAFCWILNNIRSSQISSFKNKEKLTRLIQKLCIELSTLGVFNMLLSDSKHLYCFCGKNLYWIVRKAPFGAAQLSDRNLVIDFEKETSPKDIVSVIATKPLTKNEQWNRIEPGKLIRFKHGQAIEF